MKIKKFIVQLFFIILSSLLFLGCNAKPYYDITDSMSFQALPTPQGEYESVVWLDDDHIVFIYRLDELISSEINPDFQIAIFEISSGKIKNVQLPDPPSFCLPEHSKVRVSNLAKVPDGSLGFMFSCMSGAMSGGDSLYLLDPETEALVKWNTFYGILANDFSFSPDMSQLIQEDGTGPGLNDSLLLISSDKKQKKLLPDFQRARSPVWSADGETIFFAGTKKSPENVDQFTWKWIEDLFLYPWDIYHMDADGNNPQILLPSVGNIYDLKLCPVDENLLLFAGTSFDEKDGIWLLNIKASSIKKIWSENPVSFDWSPDGSKIVLLNNIVNGWATTISILNLAENCA